MQVAFFLPGNFSFTAEKISWPSANRLYNYSADSISLDSAKRSAYIKKFLIDPLLSEDAFVKSLPTQDDRFDFVLSNLSRYHELNMQQLFNEQYYS